MIDTQFSTQSKTPAVKEYETLLAQAGLRKTHSDRGFHAGIKAIQLGDSPADVVAALQRNRPECFDEKLARKRARYA
jgi:hypothetical protein